MSKKKKKSTNVETSETASLPVFNNAVGDLFETYLESADGMSVEPLKLKLFITHSKEFA